MNKFSVIVIVTLLAVLFSRAALADDPKGRAGASPTQDQTETQPA